MAHECEDCGMECYCDQDDTGGLQQPINCRHFQEKGYCSANEYLNEEAWDDEEFDDWAHPEQERDK